jgi:hypothetical protein
MKAIINGKRYDTERATLIGEADALNFGCSSTRDFSHWEAGLYRTPRSGAFFLAGRGGPMTRFSRKVDQNSWTGGSGIHPMDRAEALEWAEEYLSADLIEQHFAGAIEDA